MKAIGLHSYGGPDVLEVLELPVPPVRAGEVRIRVRAAAVNPVDTLIRAGAAAAAFAASAPPYIPGLDVAGEIDAVGPGDTRGLRTGQRVMAMINPTRPSGGGYAEYVTLPASWVVPAPAGSSHAEASTLPANGLTALRALDHLAVAGGGTIAVSGAAGAVGGYTVQLAKAAGLRVVADAADRDTALVRALGADVVLPRGDGFGGRVRAAVPGGVDGLVDAALLDASLVDGVAPGGRIALVRGTGHSAAITAAAERQGIDARYVVVHDYDGRPDLLDTLRRLAEEGALTLRVARTIPAEQAAEAHRLLAGGGIRGRLVLAF